MLYLPFPFKHCTKCGEYYPPTFEYFAKDKISSGGQRAQCKFCCREKTREWRQNNLERAKENVRRYREQHKEEARQRSAQWRRDDPEKARQSERRYRDSHPEVRRANRLRWAKNNPEKVYASSQRWRHSHSDRVRETERKRRQTNPDVHQRASKRYRNAHAEILKERDRQRRAANIDTAREKGRQKEHRRRAKIRALPATFTDADWERALTHFHGGCAYCGNPPSLFDVNTVLQHEHHIPVNPDYELKGDNPGYTADNIVPACQSCNFSKGNKNPTQWAIKRFGKRRGESILKRIQEYFEWVRQRKVEH